MRVIYLLYRALQILGLPLLIFYFLWRGMRDAGYTRSLPQRCGFLPRSYKQTAPGAIWLHAVSVGEVLSLGEFVRQARAEFPDAPLFVSTSTLAGMATAREKLGGIAAGVFFAPLDYVSAVRRVLRTLRPSVVVVAETEIWPNLFREVKRTGAGLLVINGRISDRAAPRYLRHAWFFRPVLGLPDAILAQSEEIRRIYLKLGAPAENVRAAGNLKYDFAARPAGPGSEVRTWVEALPREGKRVWIAASTMPPAIAGDPDEDDVVIDAFQHVAAAFPGLLLILAPRKPERFDLAAQKLATRGVRFVRRTHLGSLQLPGVLLLDSIGELAGLFFLADVVFIGGTLASRGGHNVLEPALFGRPIVVGPHMENFRVIAEEFRAARAIIEVESVAGLSEAVYAVLGNPERAAAMGKRALECAEAKRGATATAIAELRRLYDTYLPRYRSLWFLPLWPLARLWERMGARRRARQLQRRRTLQRPVISIGNLAMGGTGKTPIVLYLARKLRAAGGSPGILTRGYGRLSHEKHLALPAGATVSVRESGDEPQMFLSAGVAPTGIGPDRFLTGKLLIEKFGADVLLLDDGFQHLRLDRQVDIVLVDALDPFRGGEVFPLGRLREPMTELRRADIFVITRSNYGAPVAAIESELRRYNPRAPVFHSRVQAEAWIHLGSGEAHDVGSPPFSRAGAFCGLGNPHSFWRTLERLGIHPVDRIEWADHHAYLPREVRNMAHTFGQAGADAMLTTEKDFVNLCPEAAELISPLSLYWLKIHAVLDDEDGFLAEVERLAYRPVGRSDGAGRSGSLPRRS